MPSSASPAGSASVPATPFYDIVIVGAGPAGLMLSTLLARWGYKIEHLDNRDQPTPRGRADGIQPRSMDLLDSMGLMPAIMANNPAKVYEVVFWDPSPTEKGSIVRTGSWPSCPSFLEARYPFTTLLHQGLIERVFIDDLAKHDVQVERPWTIKSFQTSNEHPDYPVEVLLESMDQCYLRKIYTKYLFSGEGARSSIRAQLNIPVTYKDPISYVWGVMDGVVRTNFPSIKMKCTVHSDHGSIMVIPRENKMVRLYIQIASSADADFDPRKTVTESEMQERAKKILKPYDIEWESVDWFSVYPIGQGIAANYSLDQRVFLGGDACHTHSPKAGQGMNTAFLDAQNLAWKIHAVEGGFASRDILKTYEIERKAVAESLLDFDNKYAKLFSERQPDADEVKAATGSNSSTSNGTNKFIETFKEACAFTSGYGVAYGPNALNWSKDQHAAKSPLIVATPKLGSGKLMIAADVTRVADANIVGLENVIPVNGSFRIFVFAGNPSSPGRRQALEDFEVHTHKPGSYLAHQAFDEIASDKVSYHEKHNIHSKWFTFATIFTGAHEDVLTDRDLPGLLARYRDHVYADDVVDYRLARKAGTAHARVGASDDMPLIVIVRPDNYVGVTVELVEGTGTVDAINEYFAAFKAVNTHSRISKFK